MAGLNLETIEGRRQTTGDHGLIVNFTEKEGTEHITIRIPGATDIIKRQASDEDRQRFEAEYKAFKEGATLGTPLEEIGISGARANRGRLAPGAGVAGARMLAVSII